MATAQLTNDLDESLAAIENRRNKESEAQRIANAKAGDAHRKRLHEYATKQKSDPKLIEYYDASPTPRQDLQADLAACKASLQRESLIAEGAKVRAEMAAATSHIKELEPQVKEATAELSATRRQHPSLPNADDMRALRTAERILQDLEDEITVARATVKRNIARDDGLRKQADALGMQIDADSELDSPLNFALLSSTSVENPPTFATADQLENYNHKLEDATAKVEQLVSEIAEEDTEVRRLKLEYEKSNADDSSPRLREIKNDLQSADDRLKKKQGDHKRLVKFCKEMTRRISRAGA